ncbi:MAG TPA: hypothetical protein PKA41_09995, partial [Verrucomicrobiota bacterium]|nr:hypothetical protein [Verrucomicrobiota bacterium]
GWDASPGNEVAGYAIYLGTSSGQYAQRYDVGGQTVSSVFGLTEGITYYITVTAYTFAGVESVPSNELAYTVPYGSPGQIPRPLVSQLQRTTQGTTLTWSSVPGGRYRVLCKDHLDDSQWAPLSADLQATGNSLQWLDSAAGTRNQRFYSILAQP